MKDSLVNRIKIRPFSGVTPNRRGYPKRLLAVGWAAVCVRGTPTALALAVAGESAVPVAVTRRSALPVLCAAVAAILRRHSKAAVYVMAHDLGEHFGPVLYPHIRPWNAKQAKHGKLTLADGVSVEWWAGKVWFARVRRGKSVALLVDAARFFAMRLEEAAALVGGAGEPVPRPDGYGSRRLGLRAIGDRLAWEAMATAVLAARVAAWHAARDLYPSVSVAQLAMRWFRHRYVKTKWQRAPRQVADAALLAYHAGRCGLYTSPGWHKVTVLDMNSAFAWAMQLLPSFGRGRWWRVWSWAGPWGFYRVTGGTLYQGKYPLLYDHGFKALPSGPIREPVWIAGPELEAARSAGLLDHADFWGYVWRPTSTSRPLRRYVRDCWTARQKEATPAGKLFWKLLLNGLYGKFIARLDADADEAADVTGDESLRRETGGEFQIAGGQWFPVAASWVTSLVRVKLWRQEWAVRSLHSATDGVMVRPSTVFEGSDKLGAWKVEARNAWALILRTKFYGVWDRGGRLVKLATHGFYGTPADLVEMLKAGRSSYVVDHRRGWIEAALAGKKPFVEQADTFTVECGVSGFWPPPCPLTIPTADGWTTVVHEGPSCLTD